MRLLKLHNADTYFCVGILGDENVQLYLIFISCLALIMKIYAAVWRDHSYVRDANFDFPSLHSMGCKTFF